MAGSKKERFRDSLLNEGSCQRIALGDSVTDQVHVQRRVFFSNCKHTISNNGRPKVRCSPASKSATLRAFSSTTSSIGSQKQSSLLMLDSDIRPSICSEHLIRTLSTPSSRSLTVDLIRQPMREPESMGHSSNPDKDGSGLNFREA